MGEWCGALELSFYVALQAVRGPDTRATMELQAKIVRVEIGAGGRKNLGRWIKENALPAVDHS